MDLIFQILGVVGVILAAIASISLMIAKSFWRLTFERLEITVVNLQEQIDILKIRHSETEAFKHKYKATVETIFELIKQKFDDFDKNFKNFEKHMEVKIDLAIAQSQIKNKNDQYS
jgi:hypothetical protein